jgi:hypothetical protein
MKPLPTMGWREWVGLPDLGVEAIKVKVDTGAASSSLHAFALKRFTSGSKEMVSFEIHPDQRTRRGAVMAVAEVVDERPVRNPGGRREIRPVIRTRVTWASFTWVTEINLTRRDEMGFRMLLGRKSLARRFLVDPGRSFLAEEWS